MRGRLVFPKDGTLIITLGGDRSILPGRVQAQKLDSLLGKIVRVNRDGSIPKNNPFVNARPAPGRKSGAMATATCRARRSMPRAGCGKVEHGAAGRRRVEPDPDGPRLWLAHHQLWRGGEEYSGKPINDNASQAPEMEQPQYYWDPVIGPSGMIFHSGKGAPEFKGNIFVGGLRVQSLVRLVMDGDKVVGEERLLTDRKERIRDVIEGPPARCICSPTRWTASC